MQHVETLIIGAGVAGASVGCSLAERGARKGVAIVDVDIYGRFSSSELNGGGVRCTFKEPINVQLSLFSTRYYLEHAELFDFRQRGYLWMYDASLWSEAAAFLPAVRAFGLPVEELSPGELKRKFPVLDDVSDLAGATFTPFDGRLSPHRLRLHYLNHAQAGGVELLDRLQVVRIDGERPPYRVSLRRLSQRSVKRTLTSEIGQFSSRAPASEELTLEANRIVNAAGPWAARVAKLYGRELPITPLPRQVFLLKHPEVDLEPLPFFLDYPQDIYFRHYELDRQDCTLVSWSDPAEKPGHDFSHHGADYYRRNVAPRLTRRIAALARAELVGGWVGHYELTPDKSAIVGETPNRAGIFNYNGLSAHGVMQSRGLGENLAEKLTTGRWLNGFDLDVLNESRFSSGQSLGERMYV